MINSSVFPSTLRSWMICVTCHIHIYCPYWRVVPSIGIIRMTTADYPKGAWWSDVPSWVCWKGGYPSPPGRYPPHGPQKSLKPLNTLQILQALSGLLGIVVKVDTASGCTWPNDKYTRGASRTHVRNIPVASALLSVIVSCVFLSSCQGFIRPVSYLTFHVSLLHSCRSACEALS